MLITPATKYCSLCPKAKKSSAKYLSSPQAGRLRLLPAAPHHTTPHRAAPLALHRPRPIWSREVEERIDHFAAGLEEEGLTPPNPDGMKLLALYSRNRPEWVIAEQVRPFAPIQDTSLRGRSSYLDSPPPPHPRLSGGRHVSFPSLSVCVCM